MNHDNEQDPKNIELRGEPELEARLIAWVAGELPDFEQAELEKLVAARPELANFKRRMELVRELVQEAEKPEAEPLRLSPERRAKLLKTLGADAGVLPLRQQIVVPAAKPAWWRGRNAQRYFAMGGMAAGLAVALVYTAMSSMDRMFGSSHEGMARVMALNTESNRAGADLKETLREQQERVDGMRSQLAADKATMDGIAAKASDAVQSAQRKRVSAPMRQGAPRVFELSAVGEEPTRPAPAEPMTVTTIVSGDELAKARTVTPSTHYSEDFGTKVVAGMKADGEKPRSMFGTVAGGAAPAPADTVPSEARMEGVAEEAAKRRAQRQPGADGQVAASNRAVLNWGNATGTTSSNFFTAGGDTYNFVLPSGGAVLNRDAGQAPTSLKAGVTGSGAPNGSMTFTESNVAVSGFDPVPALDLVTGANIVGGALSADNRTNVNGLVLSTLGESEFNFKAKTFGASSGGITARQSDGLVSYGMSPSSAVAEPPQQFGNSLAIDAQPEALAAIVPQKDVIRLDAFSVVPDLAKKAAARSRQPAPVVGLAGVVGTPAVALARTPAAAAPMVPPTGEGETSTAQEPVSTFSLHVSDVSFRLMQAWLAALERGTADTLPEPKVRAEEIYNALDYGDPFPTEREQVSARIEQAAHPLLQQRNLVRIALRVAVTGRVANQPLRLTVLLDTSGSMEREDRRAAVRQAMAELVALLGPRDRITLIGFARQPRLLAENVAGNQAGDLVRIAASTPPDGGTNIEAALTLAGELAV
ncbi:MAG: von Willebrand factor type A domain-containing protein, partial [Verrucomicrobiota bacterium]